MNSKRSDPMENFIIFINLKNFAKPRHVNLIGEIALLSIRIGILPFRSLMIRPLRIKQVP